MSNIKTNIKRIPFVYEVHNFLINGFWKKGLKVEMSGENILLSGIRVRQNGKNNRLYIGNGARLNNCHFCISGDNNVIYIGDNCSLRGTNFYFEDNNNEIHVGDGSTMTDKVDISAIEGTRVYIGEDCMISSDIYMATGDGHSVCNCDCANRINASRDILIGNHVWIGTRVIIGKGVRIGDNSIIAAGSVCTASVEKRDNVVVGGNPARIVKEGINWLRKRI